MLFTSIKTKLTGAVFVLIVAIMAATTGAALFFFEEKFRENISRDQFALLNAVATQIDEQIFKALVDLDTAADALTPAIVSNPAKAEQFLTRHKDLLDFYDNSLFLFSRNGRLMAAYPQELNFVGGDFSFRDYFSETIRTGKICISAPVLSLQKQTVPIIMFTSPVYGPGGEIIAVLGGAVSLTHQHYLRSLSLLKLGRNGFLSLYDHNRTILMHPDETNLLLIAPQDREALVERALQGFEGTVETVTIDGTPVLRSVKRLTSTDWILAISYPLADAYAPIRAARKYFLAGGVVATIFGVLPVWLLMNSLTKPLRTFTRHMEAMQALKGESRFFPTRRRDEIGILAQAFNGMVEELDKRKAAVNAQKEFAESLVQNSSLPTFVIDAQHRLLFWNKACEELTGIRSADIIGSDNHWQAFCDKKTPLLADLLIQGNDTPLALENMICNRSKLVANGWRCEGWYERLNGVRRSVIIDAAPICDEKGETIAVIETVQDVTDLKQTEQALRESEEGYRQLFENNPHPMWAYDLETLAFLAVNNAAIRHYGYSRDEFLAMTIKDIRPPEDVPLLLENVAKVATGIDAAGIWRHITRDGTGIFVEITSHTMQFGERDAEIVLAHDVTERIRAEETLRRSEERYRSIFDGVEDVIYSLSPDGSFVTLNRAFTVVTGWAREEWLGKSFSDIIYPPDRSFVTGKFLTGLRGELSPSFEFRILTKTGDILTMEGCSTPQIENNAIAGILGIARNITERKSLEEQLRQSQKMEAIGTLVGGIAHDFNNILTAIVGYATLAQQKFGTAPGGEYLEHVLSAGERAARLTRSLLAYSRKQVSNPVDMDLNTSIEETERLLRRLIPESIDFTLDLAPTPLNIRADAGQIDQILMNLTANARDAMHGTGQLRITTESIVLTEADAAFFDQCRPGRFAVLTVADSGTGMDAKTRERIFEPFFTTKEVGKGTGLGLAMVYGIVKQHSGFITCQSEPGKGTAFSIHLPLINEAREQTSSGVAPAIRGGSETILLVEDDPGVRTLTQCLLEEVGYRVVVAVDGQDAVEQFTKHHNELDLTILDVIMPKMGGIEVCRMIFELSLDARVLFVSGYMADSALDDFLLNERCAFLSKPIKPGEFLATVREMLDRT